MATSDIITKAIISSSKHKYLMLIKGTYDKILTEAQFKQNVKNNMFNASFIIQRLNGTINCIDISIYNPPTYGTKKRKVSEYADINNIESNSACNIAGNLDAGAGTRDMIYTALQTVLIFCPWIKYFKLHDYSRKLCISNEPSTGVSLSCYYIALYGKTWYESVLGAKLEDLTDRATYDECILKLYDPAYKISVNDFISLISNKGKLSPKKAELIIDAYNTTDTYFNFFAKLKQTINDNEELCLTLQPWIENFILNKLFNNTNLLIRQWIVEADSIPEVTFKDPWLVDEQYLGGKDKFDKLLENLIKKIWWVTDKRL